LVLCLCLCCSNCRKHILRHGRLRFCSSQHTTLGCCTTLPPLLLVVCVSLWFRHASLCHICCTVLLISGFSIPLSWAEAGYGFLLCWHGLHQLLHPLSDKPSVC
jgi:hypothetical protein